jgi:hypothetical protein
MTIEAMTTWLVGAMVAWSPPANHHKEGATAALARYETIAHDLAAVALDPSEKPLFEGATGRAQTALLLAAVASMESDYRKEVDTGKLRGDSGRSWCLLQVQVYGKTPEQWTGQDLVDDRKRCFRAGLHVMHESFRICHALPLEYRLSGYTSGSCWEEPLAKARARRAFSSWKKKPFTVPPEPA